ncbi:MAG: pseudouridine synthase [Treponemataceae bacterium]
MTETVVRIIAETDAYLVVYKPHGMHCAPLSEGEEGTLLSWGARLCPAILSVRGRKEVERGLLHRLDRDTEGLVLLAKTQRAYDSLSESQERGVFLKEYEALCVGSSSTVLVDRTLPFAIESGFRPFGPGRRVVRPVETDGDGNALSGRVLELALDRGHPYRTNVLALSDASSTGNIRTLVRAGLARGFRHQVRCHLAWIGLPLVGDELYGKADGENLALRAVALMFPDPENGSPVRIDLH